MQVSIKKNKMSQDNNQNQPSTESDPQSSSKEVEQTPELKPRTTKLLLNDIRKEYCILLNLIIETGFTGIEDNYRIRESLNKLIFEIRKIQDFVIKIKNKNTQSNIVPNKLKALKSKDDA
jgi:hypothetical protein